MKRHAIWTPPCDGARTHRVKAASGVPRPLHMWTTWMESPLGPLLLGATLDGVCTVAFGDCGARERQTGLLRRTSRCDIVPGAPPHLALLRKELSDYFLGALTRFSVPIVAPGRPFQRQVWEGLLKIPYGETRAYEEVAQQIGRPGAARAVGNANGLNPICILVPCHRVIRKEGALGGYGGGLWRKTWLLDLEKRTVALGLEKRTVALGQASHKRTG